VPFNINANKMIAAFATTIIMVTLTELSPKLD
jgi:hypothetical protein